MLIFYVIVVFEAVLLNCFVLTFYNRRLVDNIIFNLLILSLIYSFVFSQNDYFIIGSKRKALSDNDYSKVAYHNCNKFFYPSWLYL